MDNYIKILIVISIFCIILWIQNTDDIKYKKERKSYYDKYSLPVLVASIAGLVLTLDTCALEQYCNKVSSLFIKLNPIYIEKPEPELELPIKSNNQHSSLQSNTLQSNLQNNIQNMPINVKLPSF
jgi:hypothetical protein